MKQIVYEHNGKYLLGGIKLGALELGVKQFPQMASAPEIGRAHRLNSSHT